MADKETEVKPGFTDVKKNNDEVSRKLADQDASGHSTALTDADLRDTGGALDKLAAAHDKKVADEKEEETPPIVDPNAAPKETPPKDGEKTPDLAPKDGNPAPEPNAEELAKLEAAKEAAKKADEFFKDAPKLPPNASPKSSEAFSAIKIKAAQELSAREQAIEALKKEKADLEAKVAKAGEVSPEALKELEDLRQWRAKLDVEASPKFQEFDKRVAANQEFIYAQLKKSPAITDATIEAIKKHGGPEMVNMDKIFEAVKDPAMQRIIESRLSDIEQQKFEKEKAIKDTRDNIGKYIEEQKAHNIKSATAHNDATKAQFDTFTAKLTWFKEKPIDEKADEATKKSDAAHNEFVKTVRSHLDNALKDDSAEMRAILLTSMAQLLYTQRVHEGTRAELEAEKKKVVEIQAKLDKIAKSSTSRLRESGAPPNGSAPAPKKDDDIFNTKAGDALDNLAKQVTEERARAGVK